jgi:hypothetical protein
MAETTQETLYPTKVFLFNGETLTTSFGDSFTFSQLKTTIWKKKGWNDRSRFQFELPDYAFKVRTAEAWFTDDQTFGEFRALCVLFHDETDAKQNFLNLVLERLDERADRKKREAKKPSPGGLVTFQGELLKLSNSGNVWQKRYVLIQDFTLFYWKTEVLFRQQTPAFEVVPLGACPVERKQAQNVDTRSTRQRAGTVLAAARGAEGRPPDFQLLLRGDIVGERNYTLGTDQFALYEQFVEVLAKINLRRDKLLVYLLCEELKRRGALTSPGIFRKSGGSTEIQTLKNQFNLGIIPNLTLVRDEHALSGLVKRIFRDMDPPLLGYELYDDLLKAVKLEDEKKVIPVLHRLLQSLPTSHFALLKYLTSFLSYLVSFEEENLMTYHNIAIVFAPNILHGPPPPNGALVVPDFTNTNYEIICVRILIQNSVALFRKELDVDLKVLQQKRCSFNSCDKPVSSTHSVCSFHLDAMRKLDPKVEEKRLEAVGKWRAASTNQAKVFQTDFVRAMSDLSGAWAHLLRAAEDGIVDGTASQSVDAICTQLAQQDEAWQHAILARVSELTIALQDQTEALRIQNVNAEKAAVLRLSSATPRAVKLNAALPTLSPLEKTRGGRLSVIALSATDVPPHNGSDGSLDCFITLTVGPVKLSSQVERNTTSPNWNQEFEIENVCNDHKMIFELFERDFSVKRVDHAVFPGEGLVVSLPALAKQTGAIFGTNFDIEQEFKLHHQHRTTIRLKIKFVYYSTLKSSDVPAASPKAKVEISSCSSRSRKAVPG